MGSCQKDEQIASKYPKAFIPQILNSVAALVLKRKHGIPNGLTNLVCNQLKLKAYFLASLGLVLASEKTLDPGCPPNSLVAWLAGEIVETSDAQSMHRGKFW